VESQEELSTNSMGLARPLLWNQIRIAGKAFSSFLCLIPARKTSLIISHSHFLAELIKKDINQHIF
jgi:hypothetical protein